MAYEIRLIQRNTVKRRDHDFRCPASRVVCAAVCFIAISFASSQPVHAAVIEAWVQRYNGPGNGIDQPWAITVDTSGNVVVTGYSYNTNSSYDYYTAKYAGAIGTLLWEIRNTNGQANIVSTDGGGNVILAGYKYSANGANDEYDFYTAKFAAADGTLIWEMEFNGSANGMDVATGLLLDGNGHVVVTGYSFATNTFTTNSSYDSYTIKYASSDGAVIWAKSYNGPLDSDDFAEAVAVDGSGNVLVTGSSSDSKGKYDFFRIKYDADGTLLWEKRGPSGRDTSLSVDAGGNLLITGTSRGATGTLPIDFYTAKYAAVDGSLIWERRYNGPADSDDYARAAAMDGSGNVVVTGSSLGTGTSSDYYTAKYAAADGVLLWEKRYNGPANSFDRAGAVAVDVTGNVVVTGISDNGSSFDFYTAKYAAADGTLLWEKRYNGPADGNDHMIQSSHGLALGPSGMVAITGHSDGVAGPFVNYDYATVVYRDSLPDVSLEIIPGGVRLFSRGPPGSTYKIERAASVSGPWSSIARPVASASGLVEYIDADRPPGTAFYRTSTP